MMIGLVKENLRFLYWHLPEDWQDGDYEHVECKKASPRLISAEMGILMDIKTGEQTVFATRYLARKEFFSKESEICRKCRKCVKHLKVAKRGFDGKIKKGGEICVKAKDA